MGGVAKVMIEQSAGMMVQDLQSFLKGFEQVGLIALSRLANNLLTYGSPSESKSKKIRTEVMAEINPLKKIRNSTQEMEIMK
ncbi:hypothetical protein [Chryseobacterium wanjuense]